METAVKRLKRERRPFQGDGIVIECCSDGIKVASDEGDLLARRALSCLVEPVQGDRVLVAGDLDDEVFVIAVLERCDPSAIKLTADRDLSFVVRDGRFSVAAANGMDLLSEKEMTLSASELTLRAPTSHFFLDHLSYLGRQLFAHLEVTKLLGGVFDAILERASQKVKRSYRVVEEIDHVRSEEIDYRATKGMSLRGKNTLVTAEQLVKLDGDQIHLG